MESANLFYFVVEDTSVNKLVARVNAMIAIGWFVVGGISAQNGHYAQAMGFRGTPPDMIW